MLPNKSSVLDSFASISMTVAALVVAWVAWEGRAPAAAGPPAAPKSSLEGAALGAEVLSAGLHTGDPEAPVTIIEFSDFQCPFCGKHARDTFPRLQKDYVNAGKVSYVFRHLPLESIHPFALKAAEAAECAGRQGKFLPMHEKLFEDQGRLEEPELLASAKAIGMDEPQFAACLDGEAEAAVKNDLAEAARLGVTSTPSFLIARRNADGGAEVVRFVAGADNYDSFKRVLDDVLKKRK